MSQAEFAKQLGVSAILISMIESGQKEVSKRFITRLAKVMKVHPISITPFLFTATDSGEKTSDLERALTKWGQKMQKLLIENRAKRLKKHVG